MLRKIVCFLLVIALCMPVLVMAESFSDNPSAIELASDSVILLECYDKDGNLYCTGSAFAAFEDRVFVTNYHVIEQEVYRIIAKTEDGMMFEIDTVLATDPERDIAILKTSTNPRLPILPIGSSDSLQRGEKVIAIGSPLGLLNTVSMGIFGGYSDNGVMREILFSASISHGSSGGALFNDQGEVIGITYASIVDGQNLNLAVPISYVEELYKQENTALTIPQFYDTFNRYKEFLVSDIIHSKKAMKEEYAAVYGVAVEVLSASVILVSNYDEYIEYQRLLEEKNREENRTSRRTSNGISKRKSGAKVYQLISMLITV